MIEIRVDQIGARHGDSAAGVRAPRAVRHDRLDFPLDGLRKFFAFARKDLDAVVLERVVGRGDHDTRVVRAGARQECDRRGGHDAGAGHRRAFAARAVRELGFDPAAGLAGIAADEKLRRLGAVRQRTHERRAEPADRRRIEWRVTRGAANAVGPEQPIVCHS
jgi:hypothetical protein